MFHSNFTSPSKIEELIEQVSSTHRPIEVQMAQLVGQSLQMICFHSSRIMQDIVMSWRDCSLANRLADQKEVIPTTIRKFNYPTSLKTTEQITHKSKWHAHNHRHYLLYSMITYLKMQNASNNEETNIQNGFRLQLQIFKLIAGRPWSIRNW